MRKRYLLLVAGVILGLSIVFLLGAASERLHLSGQLAITTGCGVYQSTLSGVSGDGECYLAITNTMSGRTEIFGITEHIRERLRDKPDGRQGSVILNVSTK